MVLVAALSLAVPPAAATADPAQWPTSDGLDPDIAATPHTIRFSGPDRYQTNLALNLALRGQGGYPFDTSDRTSGNAADLAAANDWWGAASCPRSIIVVAGDTFADALAAASLSDPTDQSNQPRVRRVAAADPLFDPIGGFDRVESAYAPIVVTRSGRSGASALALTARVTAADLASGGCTTAREAIIVGGSSAVPAAVEAELVSLGYQEVFRVAGGNRYETAAAVATALGTEAVAAGTTCLDGDGTDGDTRLGFHGNAAPEYRFDARTCTVLPKAVVLADGGTGADALAAGWWTSRWQVPILLTAPDGSLPPATRGALQTLDVETIIVLGGVARIPEASVNAARDLAGAVRVGRIAGRDRTETSIEMAKAFGGWHPTGDGADFADDVLCVAASSGAGSSSTGWPDALAGGPWCAHLATTGTGSPERALPPVSGADAQHGLAGGRQPSHDAAPILLLPSGADASPSALSFLSAAFAPSSPWCSADAAGTGCAGPGFGVVLGGSAAVTSAATLALNDAFAGGLGGDRGESNPTLQNAFATGIDLGPVFLGSNPGTVEICVERGHLRDVRWLTVVDTTAAGPRFLDEADVLRLGAFAAQGVSAPACAPAPHDAVVQFAGVSLTGVHTPAFTTDLREAGRVSMSSAIRSVGEATVSAVDSQWSFDGPSLSAVSVARGSASQPVQHATLDLDLRSTADGARWDASGLASVTTAFGELDIVVQGEALATTNGWEVRGVATTTAPGTPTVRGGFRARLQQGADGAEALWILDGFPVATQVSESSR